MLKSPSIMHLALATGLSLSLASAAHAVPISQGVLTMDVNGTNGNLDEVTFAGDQFYSLGVPVSAWGLQVGTDASTFTKSDTDIAGNPFGFSSVATTAGVGATATGGAYTAGGADVGLTRSYSFISGFDAFNVSTTLTNDASTGIVLRLFENYDPDQTVFAATLNDVFVSGSGATAAIFTTARAGSEVTGAIAEVPPPSASATGFSGGFGLEINNGTALNTFFGAPADPNGVSADIGVALGWELTLAAGESVTVTSLHCYGRTAAATRSCIDDASDIPEPWTAALFGLGLLGFAGRRRSTAGI